MQETLHIVQTFTEDARGQLKADKPEQAKSAQAARSRAERLASARNGVVAFSQTGDAELGDFEEPLVLFKAGKVPEAFND
jgi:hypothetical protein